MRTITLILIVLFGYPSFSQVAFKVKLLSDQTTYQVSIRSDATWAAPFNTVSTAQVSLIVPTGGFQVSNVNSINGLWTNNTNVTAPLENPGMDYIIFGLQGATTAIPFQMGVEAPLFTFQNSGDCTGALELLENNLDPFFPPNSQNVNVGNQMGVIGAGVGVNAYTGNYATGAADCENPGGGNGGGVVVDCDNIDILDVSQTPPTMCGVADGTITITATSPIFTLQYTIDGGDNWQSDGLFTGLAAGEIFDIQVRDNAGICTEEWGLLEMDAPLAAIVLSQDFTNPGCGLSDGTITVEATSENGEPLEYSHDNGLSWQPSSTWTNLPAGTYPTLVRNLTTNCETLINTYILTEDCTGGPSDCLVTFELDKLPGDVYQVSIRPKTTWTFPNNITASTQITIKVTTGGFQPGSIVNLISGVTFDVASTYTAPVEDTAHDYISFYLTSPGTQLITFDDGVKLPLFTFENVGDCTGGVLFYMDNETDPFYPPNSLNANVGQQMTVSGFGGADLPICISTSPVMDCPLGPCDIELQDVTSTDPTSCGGSDGTITVNATATLSLEYSIDGGQTWQDNPVFNAVEAGNYTVKVRAGLGCEDEFPTQVSLLEPNGPNVLTPIADQTSCGGANVQVSIEITEPVMAFNVEGTGDFTNTVIDGSIATFEAVATGNLSTFSVEIMGMSGCIVIEEFEMNIVDIPTTTYAAPVQGCMNTEVEISYLGNASADGTLNWDVGSGTITSMSNATSSRPEGATIMVMWTETGMQDIDLLVSESGCDATSGSSIMINDIETDVTEAITNASGCMEENGEITITLSNSGDYSFNWEGGNTVSDVLNQTGLGTGDYNFTITNNDNGCFESMVFTVGGATAPPDVQTVNIVQPSCDGGDGILALTNIDPTNTFIWENDKGDTLPLTDSLSNLEAGTYFVTVTDGFGCSASNSFVLEQPEAPVLVIDNILNIDCQGNTGTVAFSVEGQTTFDYELLLNGNSQQTGTIDGGTMTSLDNLPVGDYQLVIINNQNNCTDEATFPIYSTNSISVIAVGNPPSGCGISDAEICLEIFGTSPYFTVSTNFGIAPADSILSIGCITGLYDEDVQIVITDSIGCQLNFLVELADIVTPQLSPDSVDITHAVCPDDLEAGIVAVNGSSYFVTDLSGLLVGMTTDTSLVNLAPGIYNVIQQLGDCEATLQVEIEGPTPWDIGVETIPESCEGNDGAIILNASGGTGTLNFVWSNGVTGTDTLNNLTADEFHDVIISDSLGCEYELMDLTSDTDCQDMPCQAIFSQSSVSVMAVDDVTEICLPTLVDDISNLILFLDGAIYTPPLSVCANGQQGIMVDSEPGQYVFAVMDITTDCLDTLLINILDDGIPDIDTIFVEVVLSETEIVCLDTNQLTGLPISLTNICEDLATDNALTDFNENPDSFDDLCLIISGRHLGMDQLCMVTCDDNGVCDTTIVIIDVVSRDLIIYSGMTPNGDGMNDHFNVKNIEFYPNNKLSVYGRWGTMVYQKDGYNNDWYGDFNGKDLPDGTYYYMLEDGEGQMYTGYIQLQR